VRYTVNGDVPTTGSPLYTGPVSIPATDVVSVRAFQAGKLPSETVERTYFINDPTTLPVVSVIAHSGDLFNDGTGGPGVYDNASGFTQSLTTGCSIQYFDAAHNMQFETDASLTPVGNWSLGFPQKSLQFKYDEEYGATGDIPYNIFSLDKSWLGPSHGFRVRNTDDDWGSWYGTGARMRDLVSNRMAISTHSGTAAYQNCAVFINGEYWGHYAAREMLNTYFMRDNYGADDAHVHMVKNSYPSQEYQAEVGTNTSFFEMSDFVINTDMSVESNFQQATDLIDIENWVDYWANEIYNNNQDWFPSIYFNNTRLAHAPEDGVKWKYILWDVGFSQGNAGSPWDDLLYQALEAPTVANRHTDMMKSLLENAEFKRYFINRFADLLNWNWTTTKMHALIDACAVEIAPEIPRQDAAWGSGDFEYWQGQVDNLKDFHTERPAYQREHIENYFELNGQVNITLNVTPANAGYVKISTVTPTTYPWTGIYFNGNPVTVTAVPKPGYTFVNWSTNAFISNLSQASFTANFTANTTFTAHFTG
ncbi:MAG: CotH kinase family protein, partial [Flavobacteriales bacterium]|nr:CotH kinase family protein [Flavobacteriales bacterium]